MEQQKSQTPPGATSEIAMLSALIGDAVLQPVYELGCKMGQFGYIEAVYKMSQWAAEFYAAYYPQIDAWDEFLASDACTIIAADFVDFVWIWAEQRFAAFAEAEMQEKVDPRTVSSDKQPSVVIELKRGNVVRVISTTDLRYCVLSHARNGKLQTVSGWKREARIARNLAENYQERGAPASVLTLFSRNGL